MFSILNIGVFQVLLLVATFRLLGAAAHIGRARVVLLRNRGAAISLFNASLILQGIEMLAMRMERITDVALKVAQFLTKQKKVKSLRPTVNCMQRNW